ncbi:MAG TPA: tetratricopeptide repeat protein [Sulfuricurvum sp.]|nr:tetratricopeptide repeat protein [Sulfuricurvum sp.]
MTKMMRWILLFISVGGLTAVLAVEPKSKEAQKSFWETYTEALRGDQVSQFNVGVIYERGIGVEQNQSMAAQWYEKAAEQGHVDAQYNLAIMYVSGRGVDQNTSAGMMWLANAAKHGDKESRKLLLEVIDGKYDKFVKPKLDKGISITALRMKTIKDTMICDSVGECTPIKAHITVTSKIKNGKYYKVSGVGGKNGWEPYEKEGWIEEASVEIQR